jgi:oxygen-independent coproporphyrinogen-3 oxidase
MIGLRTIWGVDLTDFNSKFSDEIQSHFNKEVKSKLEKGILQIEDNFLKIPEKSWFLADGIASDLFIV